MEDLFSADALRAALGDAVPATLIVEDVTDSTNAAARRAFLDGLSEPALFAAAEQTAGRGRLGRQFHSPKGSGVYFSLFVPQSEPRSALHVTCAAGVAVRRAIRDAVGVEVQIKWVNDLYYRDRKVCGILAEAPLLGDRAGLIIGVGINLRPVAFPPSLRAIAGDLGDTSCPRVKLIAACVRELLTALSAPSDAWVAEHRAHSCTLGRSVRILRDGAELACGIAEDVRSDGALLLRLSDGSLLPIVSGEVSVR